MPYPLQHGLRGGTSSWSELQGDICHPLSKRAASLSDDGKRPLAEGSKHWHHDTQFDGINVAGLYHSTLVTTTSGHQTSVTWHTLATGQPTSCATQVPIKEGPCPW